VIFFKYLSNEIESTTCREYTVLYPHQFVQYFNYDIIVLFRIV